MYEQKPSRLPFAEVIWRAKMTQPGEYSDPAKDTWGLAFTERLDGSLVVELLGPSILHRVVDGNVGDIYWGIEFFAFVTMRGVNKPELTGKFVSLRVEGESFFIGTDKYPIPRFDTLEDFCGELASDGIISHTNRQFGKQAALSLRSEQRNHRQATGITRKQLQQIKRAERAVVLLEKGMKPGDVAVEVGYADQAHMTRSLKNLQGKTPARVKPSF